MIFLAPFMIPWYVEVAIPPPIIPPPMPPPIPPPVPLMVITPPLIMNVICAEETGPALPILWVNVSSPLASTTECPYVQPLEPESPEDTACITQSPIMPDGENVIPG